MDPGRPKRCYMDPWAAEMVLYEALGGGQGVISAPGLPKSCYMGSWAAEMVLYEARGGGQGVIWTPGRPKRCYEGKVDTFVAAQGLIKPHSPPSTISMKQDVLAESRSR